VSQSSPTRARITGNSGSDTVNFYAQDAIGNVYAQFNGVTAEVEQQLAYDPWGAATVATVTHDTTQLRWKGLLYEGGVTGLYYMRARWYDPATRRFVSPDPQGLAAGINQFAFAGGDPINGSDPSGMDWCGNPDDPQDPEGCAGGDFPPGTTWPSATLTCIAGDANSAQNCAQAVAAFLAGTANDGSATDVDIMINGNNNSIAGLSASSGDSLGNSNCTQSNVCLAGQPNCSQTNACAASTTAPSPPAPSCTQQGLAFAGPLYSVRSGLTTSLSTGIGVGRGIVQGAGARGGIVGLLIGTAVNFEVWLAMVTTGQHACLFPNSNGMEYLLTAYGP
jgi:RHS repeat-associated protein